jgi:hypothetical protein
MPDYGGGIPVAERSLWQWAKVTSVVSPTQFQASGLQGYDDGYFSNWMCYVVRDIRSTPTVIAAPQGQQQIVTGFTKVSGIVTHPAFTVPLVAGDEIIMLHPDISTVIAAAIIALGRNVIATGTFTLSDLVQPEDNTRTEPGNHFRGCILMPVAGAAIYEPRLIIGYTGAGGIFDLDVGNPFSVLPGLVDYVIMVHQEQFVPLANGVENRLPADVTGNKTDTAITVADNVSSIIRYLKGIIPRTTNLAGAEADGVHAHADNNNWQTVFEWNPLTTRRKLLSVWMDFSLLTQSMAYRMRYMVDGANYMTFDTNTAAPWTIAADDGVLIECNFTLAHPFILELMTPAPGVEGAARNIPYNVYYEVME